MARLILPTTEAGKSKLYKEIVAKHLADGISSILLPLFVEEGIVVADVTTANNLADSTYILFEAKEKEAKKRFQILTNDFDPIAADHKVCVQSAKSFYRSTPTKLGDFSVTLVGNRVVYPGHRVQRCDDMMAFINHNASLAAGIRPITAAFQTENKIDLVANLAALPGIKTQCEDYDTANRDKETLHNTVVTERKPVTSFNRAVGHFLIKHFALNPKKAGDWGFTVDDSPKALKEVKAKFKKGETKKLYNVYIGGILQNTGDSIQEIPKGVDGTGTAIVLNPGEFWKVLPGYFDLTAKSRGILLTGQITYLKNV